MRLQGAAFVVSCRQAAITESVASITTPDDAGKVDGTLKVAQGTNAINMKCGVFTIIKSARLEVIIGGRFDTRMDFWFER